MEQLHNPLYKTTTITEIREEIKDFKTFTFDSIPDIPYKAGQYLTLVDEAQGEEVRRSYSITSSPDCGEPLTIGVKRIENGYFSRRLIDEARVGDRLRTIGAGGFFTFPEDMAAYRQAFFLAAGSGITPVYALLKTALYRHSHLRLVLIYSNSSPDKAIFREALETLAARYPQQLQVEFIYSNARDLGRAHLYRDLLVQFLDRYSVAPKEETLYYICGPEAYMRMCTYTLQEESVPADHIRRENFIIQKMRPPKAVPPDTDRHAVTLHLGGVRYRFPVRYPQTILAGAKAAGLALPYSCEVGRCGNCVARCSDGKVWHSYNEVLTEKELARGLTLTCVAYPIGGDVTLEIG